MQALYRGNKGRKLAEWKSLPQSERAATILQKVLKGRIARRRFILVVEAARQREARQREEAKKAEEKRKAEIKR